MRRKYRSLTATMTHPRRLEAGNKVIRMLNTLLLTVLAGTAVFVCFLLCLKPWQQLRETEDTHNSTMKERDAWRLKKEQKEKELEWLIYDNGYFDLMVRDKVDMAQPGETVIRIERTQKESTPSPAETDKPVASGDNNTPAVPAASRNSR